MSLNATNAWTFNAATALYLCLQPSMTCLPGLFLAAVQGKRSCIMQVHVTMSLTCIV